MPGAIGESRARLHGGVRITGWTMWDVQAGIWRAPLPASVPDVRQIYVNGIRAVRPQTRTYTHHRFLVSLDRFI